MGRNINTENVNKNFVLSKVSQLTIFSTYFNISPDTIQYCIDTGNFINSPIREDVHPSFGFKYDNRGRLKGKDFAGYFWGDCFDAAAFVISRLENKRINIANKGDFIYVLKHIMITHKQFFYGGEQDATLTEAIKPMNIEKNKKPNLAIPGNPGGVDMTMGAGIVGSEMGMGNYGFGAPGVGVDEDMPADIF